MQMQCLFFVQPNSSLSRLPASTVYFLSFFVSFSSTLNNNKQSLPSEWASLGNLLRIIASEAGLVGTLPSQWSALSSLEQLSLNENELEGSLPSEWAALTNLRSLSIERNDLTGTLPPEYAALQRLTGLALSRNRALTGTIPPVYTNLTALTDFEMNNCNLTGTIPPFTHTFEDFSLFNNRLVGVVPPLNITDDCEIYSRGESETNCFSNVTTCASSCCANPRRCRYPAECEPCTIITANLTCTDTLCPTTLDCQPFVAGWRGKECHTFMSSNQPACIDEFCVELDNPQSPTPDDAAACQFSPTVALGSCEDIECIRPDACQLGEPVDRYLVRSISSLCFVRGERGACADGLVCGDLGACVEADSGMAPSVDASSDQTPAPKKSHAPTTLLSAAALVAAAFAVFL